MYQKNIFGLSHYKKFCIKTSLMTGTKMNMPVLLFLALKDLSYSILEFFYFCVIFWSLKLLKIVYFSIAVSDIAWHINTQKKLSPLLWHFFSMVCVITVSHQKNTEFWQYNPLVSVSMYHFHWSNSICMYISPFELACLCSSMCTLLCSEK